jgi:hypothetical protein
VLKSYRCSLSGTGKMHKPEADATSLVERRLLRELGNKRAWDAGQHAL